MELFMEEIMLTSWYGKYLIIQRGIFTFQVVFQDFWTINRNVVKPCRLLAEGTKVSKSGDSSSMARRTREEKFSESFLDSRRVSQKWSGTWRIIPLSTWWARTSCRWTSDFWNLLKIYLRQSIRRQKINPFPVILLTTKHVTTNWPPTNRDEVWSWFDSPGSCQKNPSWTRPKFEFWCR